MPRDRRSVMRRLPRGIDRAMDRVMARIGRSPGDPVVEVVGYVLSTRCKTASSVEAYADRLIRLIRFLDDAGVEVFSATRADLLRYIERNEALSPTTQSAYQAVAKVFYADAEEMHEVNVSPYQRMPKLQPEAEQHAPPLTKLEIEKVLNEITKDFGHPDRGLGARRDHAMINLMIHTALRAFEVSGLIWDGVTPRDDDAEIAFLGKGGKPATMKLPAVAYLDLGRWSEAFETETRFVLRGRDPVFFPLAGKVAAAARRLGQLPDDAWLEPNAINAIVKRRFAAVGIERYGMAAHSLRSTAAVLAYLAGADLLQIQQFLRHKSLETTRVYLSAILPLAQNVAIDSIKLDLIGETTELSIGPRVTLPPLAKLGTLVDARHAGTQRALAPAARL